MGRGQSLLPPDPGPESTDQAGPVPARWSHLGHSLSRQELQSRYEMIPALTDLNCPPFTGGYYKQSPEAGAVCPQSPRFNLRETGLRFLQRLSGLRQSVRRSKITPLREQARLPPTQGQFDDSDRVFFRGFSGADKLSEYESVRLRPHPTAPPRRKKTKLTRSFSLTYGDIVVKRVIICLKIKRKHIDNDCFHLDN